MLGGHQEHGRRAGTENVPYIAGLGKAAELAAANLEKENTYVKELRDRLETGLLAIKNSRVNGGGAWRGVISTLEPANLKPPVDPGPKIAVVPPVPVPTTKTADPPVVVRPADPPVDPNHKIRPNIFDNPPDKPDLKTPKPTTKKSVFD